MQSGKLVMHSAEAARHSLGSRARQEILFSHLLIGSQCDWLWQLARVVISEHTILSQEPVPEGFQILGPEQVQALWIPWLGAAPVIESQSKVVW